LKPLLGGRKLFHGGWRHRDAAAEKRGWTVYARSTTVQAQTSSIDDGIAYVRDEVMPALQAMDGYVGLSLLVDRESGRCIATSAWDTDEAIRTSTEQAAPLRDRAAAMFGGSDAAVALWEIGAMHRDHRSADGACVRATWIKMPPDHADRAIEFYRTSVLPSLEELEGFCSASFLVNRATGRGVSSATFDSREAMERNQEDARELRNARTRELGADILDVGEFELTLAHLRLPEMA
jgi:heme-degrading monooxygenase HmoA